MALAANSYLVWDATTGALVERKAIQSSAGAGDAAKIPALDPTGKLDPSFMPTGIAAPTQVIVASEALAAGDLVNVWSSTGAKVRKADATVAGKEANGYVLASVASSGNATVYFSDILVGLSGLTPGASYFLSTSAGVATSTPPTASGNVVQPIGKATSATTIAFEQQTPIVLA